MPVLSPVRRLIVFTLSLVLAGCTPLFGGGAPLVFLPPAGATAPPYLAAAPGVTPTPTPFRPLPEQDSIHFAWSDLPALLQAAAAQPAGPVNSNIQPAVPPSAAEPPPGVTPQPVPPASQVASLSNQVHILLLGSDLRPQDVGFRTDTIILLTVNSTLGRANLLSFPRDLYVNIPGYGYNRINTAMSLGDFALLQDTFFENFGVRPDYYVLVNFSSFKTIVDDLDGLDVQVAEPLSDYRYGYWTTIQPGLQHMDADTVLWYVRSRLTSNDFDRSRRQEEVLRAMFNRLLSLNALQRVPEFFSTYRRGVTTNVSFADVLYWLPAAASVVQKQDINFYHISYEHVYDWISPAGGMVLMPNPQPLTLLIRQALNLP